LEIESAFSRKGGFYGLSPKEFSKAVRDLGMSWKSHHVLGAPFKLPPGAKMPLGADGKPISLPSLHNLKENMQSIVDEASEGGIDYLVCANTPINTLADIQSSIEVLNKTGEACKKAGIKFCYHNHDAEFKEVEGKVPYDLFLKQLDSHNVHFELDLAWAIKGGADPVRLFKDNPGRFPLWHLKDLDSTRNLVLPVGEGTLNFAPIIEAAKIGGMKHIFVEHDMPKDPLASIKSSYSYITEKLKV
jgi:sugar phosphate isomerase/epimerase